MTSYQCVICYGPTSLKGGGLCFHDAMAIGGKGTSELWCHQCQDKLPPPRPVKATWAALRTLAASAE